MGVIEAVLDRRVAHFYLRLSAQIRVYLRSSDFFSRLGQIPVDETYKGRSTSVIGAEISVVKLRTVRHVPNTGQGCIQSEHVSGPPIPARAATGGPDTPGHDDWGAATK
jgi:hypothetical protein